MQTEDLKISGITGEGCANKISTALLIIDGVSEVTISNAGRNATVQFDEEITSVQELQVSLIRAGYGIEADKPAAEKAGGCCGGCGGKSC